MAAAPADSTCSHSGIFTCGAARLTTAITSGACARRLRSNSTCSGFASGYLARNAVAMAVPAASRASPSNTIKRQGVSLPWSGHAAGYGQKLVDFGSGWSGGRQCDGFEGSSRGKEFNGIGHGVPNKDRSRRVKERTFAKRSSNLATGNFQQHRADGGDRDVAFLRLAAKRLRMSISRRSPAGAQRPSCSRRTRRGGSRPISS